MWIAAAQFQDLSAKFVRKRLTQVFTFFSPGIQADFKVEQIGRNLIGHNISSRSKESVALEDKRRIAIRHDGLPKGDSIYGPLVACSTPRGITGKIAVRFRDSRQPRASCSTPRGITGKIASHDPAIKDAEEGAQRLAASPEKSLSGIQDRRRIHV